MTRGQKMPYFVGEDGKHYYNFAQGLKVELCENDGGKLERYTLEIVACNFINGTEYYSVERDGMALPQPLSANRLRYLFSRYGVKTLAAGKRRELPLLLEEVKGYYEERERARQKKIAQAEAIPEYTVIHKQIRYLDMQIGFAQARGQEEKAAALFQRQAELRAKSDDVLNAHGIDPEEISEPQKCEKCDGKGYNFNHICECAINMTDEIKEFFALNRLRLIELTE